MWSQLLTTAQLPLAFTSDCPDLIYCLTWKWLYLTVDLLPSSINCHLLPASKSVKAVLWQLSCDKIPIAPLQVLKNKHQFQTLGEGVGGVAFSQFMLAQRICDKGSAKHLVLHECEWCTFPCNQISITYTVTVWYFWILYLPYIDNSVSDGYTVWKLNSSLAFLEQILLTVQHTTLKYFWMKVQASYIPWEIC